ncbi:MAG: hypothetical protein UE068_01150 [Paludibacteraceae bacterium]|nr:hypothetical protein [Paludibacteraceae bacterium]
MIDSDISIEDVIKVIFVGIFAFFVGLYLWYDIYVALERKKTIDEILLNGDGFVVAGEASDYSHTRSGGYSTISYTNAEGKKNEVEMRGYVYDAVLVAYTPNTDPICMRQYDCSSVQYLYFKKERPISKIDKYSFFKNKQDSIIELSNKRVISAIVENTKYNTKDSLYYVFFDAISSDSLVWYKKEIKQYNDNDSVLIEFDSENPHAFHVSESHPSKESFDYYNMPYGRKKIAEDVAY